MNFLVFGERMVSLNSCLPVSFNKSPSNLPSFLFLSPRNPKLLPFTIFRILRARSSSAAKHQEPIRASYAGVQLEETVEPIRTSYAGVQLEETVDETKQGKLRLDSWISSRIQGISRARVQSSIKSGLVTVNGRVVDKVNSIFLLVLN